MGTRSQDVSPCVPVSYTPFKQGEATSAFAALFLHEQIGVLFT
jgi:hypothetical protein